MYPLVKMGQKSDLTKIEKSRIVSILANEVSTLQIAKQLNKKEQKRNSLKTVSILDLAQIKVK